MDSKALYRLLGGWLSKTYLSEEVFEYDESIFNAGLSEFYYDYRRWYPDDDTVDPHKLTLTPQLHAILTYRLTRRWYVERKNERQATICSTLGRISGLTEIYYSASIGHGLKINHGIGCVIGARCTIGENCLLHQGVTIGDRKGGRPTIGNRVTIYAGAMVLGKISIGDDCVIGANSVCLQDAPPQSVLIGAPARILHGKE